MPLPFALTALGLLAFAAWRDVATRTMPDGVSVALAVLGLALRCAEGWQAVALSTAVAAGLFFVLFLCHARGMIGGADVKLLTALALGLSPLGAYQLIAATTLTGGVLAVLYLVLARALASAPSPSSSLPPWRRSFAPFRVAAVELWRIRRRGPLPYGVAIAIGGALTLLNSPGV